MLQHLLCSAFVLSPMHVYSAFSLVNWHCSYSAFFFYFINRFVFFFFFLLNIYVSWYIYCYTNTTNFTIFLQLLMCTNALKHYNYNALVLWATVATVIFFFSSNRFVIFFFPFKYLCKLVYILLYWHKKFHNIFTIIDMSISYKSK